MIIMTAVQANGDISDDDDFIIDIDSIQAHGISRITHKHTDLTRYRCGGCRHHEAEGEWLLHYCSVSCTPVSF